jgi:hypothetical protein
LDFLQKKVSINFSNKIKKKINKANKIQTLFSTLSTNIELVVADLGGQPLPASLGAELEAKVRALEAKTRFGVRVGFPIFFNVNKVKNGKK